MPRSLATTPLTAAEQKLLDKYSLKLVKDIPEADQRALRKARKHRRAIRLARKAQGEGTTKAAKSVAAKPEPAAPTAKPGKQTRKIRKANTAHSVTPAPTNATVAAFKAAGGKVTKVPEGRKTLTKDDLKAALTGDTLEQVQAERELALAE